jgi:hypothetical protein
LIDGDWQLHKYSHRARPAGARTMLCPDLPLKKTVKTYQFAAEAGWIAFESAKMLFSMAKKQGGAVQ